MSASYLGNSLSQYATALGILAVGFVLVFFVNRVVKRWLNTRRAKSDSTVDDFLLTFTEKTIFPLLAVGIFYLSLNSLSLYSGIEKALRVGGVVLFTILGVRFFITALQFMLFCYWLPKHSNHETLEYQLKGLMPAMAVMTWTMATVFLLDNLGFKISSIIAGLGIGGVAIALASQAVLADLFSYFAILFDKPFVIGDFIVIGNLMGTVENIGIKTTRVRSLSGEELIFGNKDLTSATIHNFKRMRSRRVEFHVGVVYETDTSELREIPDLFRSIISSIEHTAFERAHFSGYTPNGLNFEIVYIVTSDDYNVYMNIQQEINLRIKEEFEKRNIHFAYPAQTVYLNRLRQAIPSNLVASRT